MRRFGFLMLAFYLIFLGGSSYYYQIFAIRVAHHAIITLGLITWLGLRLAKGRGIPPSPLNPLIYAAVIGWGITAAFALDPRIAFESMWFLIIHVLIFLFMVDMIQSGRLRLLMETQFLLAAVICIAAGAQLATWIGAWLPLLNAEMPLPPILPRLDQPFGVSTWLSAYSAPLAVLIAAWALTVRRRDYRPVLWILSALALALLFLSGSRGGFVSLMVALALFGGFRIWHHPRINRVITLGIGAVIVIGIIGGVIFLMSRDAGRTTGDRLRADLWASSIEMFTADPLTGVGIGQFGRAHRLYRDPTYVDDRLGTAHNLYLNVMGEMGVIGIALLVGFGVVILWAWYQQWSEASAGRQLRLEATFAALIGMAVHSLFDTFTLTAIVTLPLLLIAFNTTAPRSIIDPPIKGQRIPAFIALLIVAGFGVFWLQVDRAHSAFNRSVSDSSLEAIDEAIALDPSMRLYQLQRAYLIATDLTTPPQEAIAAYESAITLEPTWDTGLINLAALEETQGNIDQALVYLQQAGDIRHQNGAWFGWGRLAEDANLDADAIIAAYSRAGIYLPFPSNSEYWSATEVRQAAIEAILEYFANNEEVQFRILKYLAMNQTQLEALIPTNPSTAQDWWLMGQAELIQNNPEGAREAFNHAIQLAPQNGNYYVSRALATLATGNDPATLDAANRDLDIAQLLTPNIEEIAPVRVVAARDDAERLSAVIQGLSSNVPQNFEGVLYQGRRANFQPVTRMISAGKDSLELHPYYNFAELSLAQNAPQQATRVYQILLQNNPFDSHSMERLSEIAP